MIGTPDVLTVAGEWSALGVLTLSTTLHTTAPFVQPTGPLNPIPKGAAWKLPITWRHNDNTQDLSAGYTALFRAWIDPASAPVLTLTQGAGITLSDGASGPNIVIAQTGAQTSVLSFTRVRCRLDVTRTSDGFVWRLLEGAVDLH